MKYQFLSSEWIEAAKEIREQHRHEIRSAQGSEVRANLIFTGAPHGDDVEAHLSSDVMGSNLSLGHLEAVDATVTTSFATAKAIFCDRDFSASMKAFMRGEILVDGDVTKLLDLMTLASDESDPNNVSISEQVRAITLD